jgi:hypothetical protein
MARKFRTKPEGMDGQRHDRFVARMQQIGVLEDVKNFEKAFQKAFKSAFATPPAEGDLPDVERTAWLTNGALIGSDKFQVMRVCAITLLGAVAGIAALAAQGSAVCADMPPLETESSLPASSFVNGRQPPGSQFEARFGAFAAGVGSAEQGTVDLTHHF